MYLRYLLIGCVAAAGLSLVACEKPAASNKATATAAAGNAVAKEDSSATSSAPKGANGDGASVSPDRYASDDAASHRYDFKEGDSYGYLTDPTEEEKKAGKIADEIFVFKYIGKKDGVYSLRDAKDSNVVLSCSKPCTTIKVEYQGHLIRQKTYSTDSVFGAAFDDAFNGALEQASDKPATSNDASSTSGD